MEVASVNFVMSLSLALIGCSNGDACECDMKNALIFIPGSSTWPAQWSAGPELADKHGFVRIPKSACQYLAIPLALFENK
jgi:hypothetical protein